MKKIFLPLLFVFLTSFVYSADLTLPKIPKEIIFSHYKLSEQSLMMTIGAIKLFNYQGVGSAICISKRELICCAHEIVNKDATHTIEVYNKDGEFEKRIIVKIKKFTPEKDLTLLTVEEDLPYSIDIKKDNISNMEIGDFCYSIGARGNGPPFGITTGFFLSKNIDQCIGVTMHICPGDSGGGIYDFQTNSLLALTQATERFNAYGLGISNKTINDWLNEKEVKLEDIMKKEAEVKK